MATLTSITANTSQHDSALKKSITTIQRMIDATKRMGESLKENDQMIANFAAKVGSAGTKAGNTKAAINEMTNAIAQLNGMMKQVERGGSAFNTMSAQVEQLRSRIRSAKDDLAVANGNDRTNIFAGVLGGNLATRGVTMALSEFKAAAANFVDTNKKFEQSNANLAAVLGGTRDKIQDLTNDAIKYGMQTKFTADEVTSLQTALARLGMTQGEIKNATKPVLDLATATGVDLSHAAQLAGSALRAYGLNAADTDHVASVLAVSTTKSALTIDKLGTSLGYAASVSRQAGLNIEDTVAMLGKLTDSGIQATTAGVGIRNIMMDLTDKNSKLAKAIGHPVKGLDGFLDALDEFKKKGISMEEVSEIMQRRVTPSFLTLLSNTKGIRELRDQLKDCRGELKGMAEEQMNTLEGSTLKMKSAWDALMLSFKSSNGTLKSITDAVTKLIAKYARARNIANGGDSAIAALKEEADDNAAGEILSKYDQKALEDGTALKAEEENLKNLQEEAKKLRDLYDQWMSARAHGFTSQQMQALTPQIEEMFGRNDWTVNEKLAKKVAEAVSKVDVAELVVGKLKPSQLDDISGNKGGNINVGSKKGDPHAEERAILEREYAELVANIDRENQTKYEAALEEMSIKSAMYDEIAALYTDDNLRYQKALRDKFNMLNKATTQLEKIEVEENKAALEAQAQEQIEQLKKNEMGEREYADAVFEIRKKLIEDLINLYANDPANQSKQKKAMASLGSQHQSSMPKTMNAVYTDYATGIVDVENAMAQLRVILSSTNSELERLWATDKMREYAKQLADITNTEVRQFKEDLGSMQNIWGGVTSGVDSVTSAIDTMKNAIDGDANAWEVLCSVIDGTFGVLNSVASITETLNTLTTIGTALEEEHTKSKLQGALASGIKASAEGSLAAAQAGESVAGIPIVGPVLAVAAIGAVAAAIAAAFSKTEYHADGGFIGGGPKGSDVVPMWGTPGELVLNRSQQTALAGQLAGSAIGNDQGHQGTPYVNGELVMLGVNNYLRRTGKGELVTTKTMRR